MICRCSILGITLAVIPLISAESRKSAPEPKISSIYPMTATAGRSFHAVIRGTALAGAQSVIFTDTGFRGRVLGCAPEQAEEARGKPADLAQVELSIPAEAKPGDHAFRLITPAGLTNELVIRSTNEHILAESDATGPLQQFPLTINGRLAKRGESDSYWLELSAAQKLTFEVVSGSPAFDPSIAIYEPSGSWFDAKRLNRIAFNDEPLHFPGLASNPRLTYVFAKGGKYCLRVNAFTGQGGPDFVYELRITPAETPAPTLHPKRKETWEERQFTRVVSAEWMRDIAKRSGAKVDPKVPEIYTAVSADSREIPIMSAPGIIQGTIRKPAEVDRIKLRVDKPQDLAFEIETPSATMPRFNPIIRILEPSGSEVVTDVHTKLNNNGLYMMKMIQAKTTVSLNNPGEYILEIRDITTDCSGDDFTYRVLVRPQIPHVGRMLIAEDTLNLRAGTTKSLTVMVEREENFESPITFDVEGLPGGVTALLASSTPEEKPALFNGGKMERYTPKSHKAVLLFVASTEATAMTTPAKIRIVARPFVNGVLGDPIPVKEMPLLVIPRSAS